MNRRMDSPRSTRHWVRGRAAARPSRPGVPDHLPHDGAPPQVGARGDDGGLHPVGGPGVGDHPGDGPVFRQDLHHLRLLHPKVLLELQGVLHDLLVLPTVCLGPEGPDGRALPPVQNPVLDAGLVRRPAHLAPQGVQLPDQVALSGPAMAGLQGMLPTASRLMVKHRVFKPMRAADRAASMPAWPAPITTISYCPASYRII